ncbi:MAG: AAA family ATPase [Bacillota bacterium]
MTEYKNRIDFSDEKDNLSYETCERLKEFIDASGKTQAAAARELGVSEALLSQFLSGTYKGNINDVTEKIKQYIEFETKKIVLPCFPEFTETSVTKGIWYALKFAHVHGDIALIFGEAGRSKSITLKEYARKNEKVIYIEADATISNAKSVLEEIWEALGNKNKEPERYLKKGIIEALQDSGVLIIIDDAQHLTLKAMDIMRVIHEHAKIGIAFCGNQHVYDRMLGREATQYAQLYSRIGIKKYIQAAVSMDDVKDILKAININVNKDCITFLHKLANSRGGLRYMLKIYMIAEMAARAKGEKRNVHHLSIANKIHSGK